MKVACIIQARTSSTRLPGKVLKSLPYSSGISVLSQVISRVKAINGVDQVVVATTLDVADDAIEDIGKIEQVKVFRGSKDNVLERYYLAAKGVQADQVIRVTSDCPCLDPILVSDLLQLHLINKADYSTNSLNRFLPHGLDAEVISFSALEQAYNNATEDFQKEHVTPYIYKSHPESFKIVQYAAPVEWHAPDIRVTIDTEEDYGLLCAVYDYLYPKNPEFGIRELLQLFNKKPWLKLLNKAVKQKKVYASLEEEKIDAIKILDLGGFNRIIEILKTE